MYWDMVTFIYLSIMLLLALLGNALVLCILGCRWIATSSAQVYIMTLAVLNFVCALVSAPREIMNLTADLKGWNVTYDSSYLTAVHVYCGISSFFTYLCSLACAFILVCIALTRYHKYALRGQGQEQGKDAWLQRQCRHGVERLSTARGAQVVSGCAVVACGALSVPILIGLSRPQGDYSHCLHSVELRYQHFLLPIHLFYFAVFLVLALCLVALYGAVLYRLRFRQRDQRGRTGSLPDPPPFCAHQSPCNSDGSVLNPFQDFPDLPSHDQLQVATDMTSSKGNASACPRSPDPEAELEQPRKGQGRSKERTRRRSDWATQPDFLPPVSYSAQQMSLDPTTSARRSSSASEPRGGGRPVLQSGGNPAKQTIVVFVLITLIYIVSYLPIFVAVLFAPRQWAPSKLLHSSYLISVAFNPIVYAINNRHFRYALYRLICCRVEVI